MNHSMRLSALLIAMAMSTAAFAGHPPKSPPKPTPAPKPAPTIYSAHLDARSAADSVSSATGGAATAQGGAGGAGGASEATAEATGGQGVGDVDVGGDSTRVRSLGIALSVPAATAAPAVPGECLRHSRGWQAGWGAAARSGGTTFDEKQCDRVHCLAIADRYHKAGLLQAMADQLATCGGVSVTVILPPTPVAVTTPPQPPAPAYVTREELQALRAEQREAMERALARGMGK